MIKLLNFTHAFAVGGLAIILMATSAAQPALAVNRETVPAQELEVRPLWFAEANASSSSAGNVGMNAGAVVGAVAGGVAGGVVGAGAGGLCAVGGAVLGVGAGGGSGAVVGRVVGTAWGYGTYAATTGWHAVFGHSGPSDVAVAAPVSGAFDH